MADAKALIPRVVLRVHRVVRLWLSLADLQVFRDRERQLLFWYVSPKRVDKIGVVEVRLTKDPKGPLPRSQLMTNLSFIDNRHLQADNRHLHAAMASLP